MAWGSGAEREERRRAARRAAAQRSRDAHPGTRVCPGCGFRYRGPRCPRADHPSHPTKD